jgi:hypothetical protein
MLMKQIVRDTGGLQRSLAQGDIVGSAEGVGTSLATVGAGTLSAAILVTNFITRTGPTGAYTDTTDTAANIIAALGGNSGVSAGDSYRFKFINTVAFAMTLAGGTGVTLVGGNTGVNASSVKEYLVRITNATPTATVVGNIDGTTAVITGLDLGETSQLSVGQGITGTGIPASTSIIGIVPGVSITLSANTTVAGTNVAITSNPTVTITGLGQGLL